MSKARVVELLQHLAMGRRAAAEELAELIYPEPVPAPAVVEVPLVGLPVIDPPAVDSPVAAPEPLAEPAAEAEQPAPAPATSRKKKA